MVAIKSLATILTYLIGLCGMIPLFPWLTTFPRVILVAGLIVGLWQDRRCWYLKPWMLNVAIVPVFLYNVLQFSRSNPIQPVVSVLTVMWAVRLSGEKTVRYSLQAYAISIFCLASSSLFNLSPVFLIYLGFLLLMVALALVLLTFQNQDHAMMVSYRSSRKTSELYRQFAIERLGCTTQLDKPVFLSAAARSASSKNNGPCLGYCSCWKR